MKVKLKSKVRLAKAVLLRLFCRGIWKKLSELRKSHPRFLRFNLTKACVFELVFCLFKSLYLSLKLMQIIPFAHIKGKSQEKNISLWIFFVFLKIGSTLAAAGQFWKQSDLSDLFCNGLDLRMTQLSRSTLSRLTREQSLDWSSMATKIPPAECRICSIVPRAGHRP